MKNRKVSYLFLALVLLGIFFQNSKKEDQITAKLFRRISSDQPLITYCTRDTVPAASEEEKKLREAFSFEFLDRICNKIPSLAKLRINFQDWNKSRYLETSWVNGINLTGVQHGVPRGTAITSRHVIFTKHYSFHGQVGDTLFFLTMDNRLITRKVVAVKYIDNDDLAIARLEYDLPGSITPLKILHPDTANIIPNYVPMLRIDQESKALIVEKAQHGPQLPETRPALGNIPAGAFAQYYEDMVRFDSSSPSILLLRTEYGVIPILYSLVTMAGAGYGPYIHQNISQIEAVIASFGDTHQLEKVTLPMTSWGAPSCSILAQRGDSESTCELKITSSASPVTGTPAIEPSSPQNWTISGNTWTSTVTCSSEPSTFFKATLMGPGGTGRTCESGSVGPILPKCRLEVNRRGNTNICDVKVTRQVGNPVGNPMFFPETITDWERLGDEWSGTTNCSTQLNTTFAAHLTDEAGKGPECTATVNIVSEVPTCEISTERIGYSGNCRVNVTKKSGSVSGNPILNLEASSDWVRNGDIYTVIAGCNEEDYSTFSAQFSGPLGLGPSCVASSVLPVHPDIPFCELKAARQGLTNVCKLTAILTRGKIREQGPIAFPSNPTNWKNNYPVFEATVGCPYNVTSRFRAYFPNFYEGDGRICEAPTVEKIPAPSCDLEVARVGTSNKCNYTLSARSTIGTISRFNFNGSTNKISWNGGNSIRGQLTCSQIADSTFSAYLWGVGGTPQKGICHSSVPKIPPPSCRLTAQRRGKSAICDLSLAFSGVINSSKAPKISPLGSGHWNNSSWIGTSSCSNNKATTFTATIYGPGGSQAFCTSNIVPRL